MNSKFIIYLVLIAGALGFVLMKTKKNYTKNSSDLNLSENKIPSYKKAKIDKSEKRVQEPNDVNSYKTIESEIEVPKIQDIKIEEGNLDEVAKSLEHSDMTSEEKERYLANYNESVKEYNKNVEINQKRLDERDAMMKQERQEIEQESRARAEALKMETKKIEQADNQRMKEQAAKDAELDQKIKSLQSKNGLQPESTDLLPNR